MHKRMFLLNILILTALVATTSLGWLAGHILRYSFYTLWHPPIQQVDPRIKTGFEFESGSIRRLALLPEIYQASHAKIYFDQLQDTLFDRCTKNTYYTSLLAKCRSISGELVRAGEGSWEIILVP